jgi:hypothetical protein
MITILVGLIRVLSPEVDSYIAPQINFYEKRDEEPGF